MQKNIFKDEMKEGGWGWRKGVRLNQFLNLKTRGRDEDEEDENGEREREKKTQQTPSPPKTTRHKPNDKISEQRNRRIWDDAGMKMRKEKRQSGSRGGGGGRDAPSHKINFFNTTPYKQN